MAIIFGLAIGFVAFLLIGMILLQEGKGGGITAMGGAGMENVVGARHPLRRLTVIFSVIFMVLILGAGYYYNKSAHKAVAPELVAPQSVSAEQPAAPAASAATTDAGPVAGPAVPAVPAGPAEAPKGAETPAPVATAVDATKSAAEPATSATDKAPAADTKASEKKDK